MKIQPHFEHQESKKQLLIEYLIVLATGFVSFKAKIKTQVAKFDLQNQEERGKKKKNGGQEGMGFNCKMVAFWVGCKGKETGSDYENQI